MHKWVKSVLYLIWCWLSYRPVVSTEGRTLLLNLVWPSPHWLASLDLGCGVGEFWIVPRFSSFVFPIWPVDRKSGQIFVCCSLREGGTEKEREIVCVCVCVCECVCWWLVISGILPHATDFREVLRSGNVHPRLSWPAPFCPILVAIPLDSVHDAQWMLYSLGMYGTYNNDTRIWDQLTSPGRLLIEFVKLESLSRER